MSRSHTTLAASLCLAALTLTGVGCGGGLPVRGAVIAGPVGLAQVVDARDERLDGGGLGGVQVKAVRPGTETSGGIAPLATAVTDDTGLFQMKISDRDKIRGPIVVITESPDSFRTATRIYPPRAGQEVLINVRERRSAGATETSE
ncbi:MAG: hypothetical protein DHS20C14_08610 [Phycisphaeraceae bacterium]|nr:MAG: hypothetical protein DHS20C14_08610 [Phycisphaeraceae bacterium]